MVVRSRDMIGTPGGAAMRYVSAAAMGALLLAATADAQPPKPAVDINGDPLPAGAVSRLGTTRFQPPQFAPLALSPDGRTIAAFNHAENGRVIEYIDATTGKSRDVRPPADDTRDDFYRFADFIFDRTNLQFSPDGKELAVCKRDRIALIDACTGEVARTINTGAEMSIVAYRADGRRVAGQPEESRRDAPV